MTITQRPFFNASIEDLEHASNAASTLGELESLAEELERRTTKRAKELLAKVRSDIADHADLVSFETAPASEWEALEIDLDAICREEGLGQHRPRSSGTVDDSIRRLNAWIAMEALSPQTYRHPKDLVGGEHARVAFIERGLPWEKVDRSRPKYRMYYEIVLGTIDMDLASQALIQAFGADEERERRGKESAILATIIVDAKGIPVEEKGIAVSSFGWALRHCLNRNLEILPAWPHLQQKLTEWIGNRINRVDAHGNPIPVDAELINAIYRSLIAYFDIPAEMIKAPEFVLRQYQYYKRKESPEPLLLNSFFLEDLASASAALRTRKPIGKALAAYLSGNGPPSPIDFLKGAAALENAVAPSNTPSARWPAGPDRTLVLLQQAAVNEISAMSGKAGLFAVNGPPGTGKTTLIRDIVADLVTQRAEIMCQLSDPAKAFSTTGQKVPTGGAGFWHLYALNQKLRGFEMLVASSNNAAVENVTKELPGLGAVADSSLNYFRTVSDTLSREMARNKEDESENDIAHKGTETWGLIAAVLGNRMNRGRFANAFWWDDDRGMRTYLKAAKGDDTMIEERDEDGRLLSRRQPVIIETESPPAGPNIALQQWTKARRTFAAVRREVKALETESEAVRQLCLKLGAQEYEVQSALQACLAEGNKLSSVLSPRNPFHAIWRSHSDQPKKTLSRLHNNQQCRPGLLCRVLGTQAARQWDVFQAAINRYNEQVTDLDTLKSRVDHSRSRYGKNLLSPDFFSLPHEERQIVSPWVFPELSKKREELFEAALDVHRTFVGVNAQKLLHNLSVTMMILQGQLAPDEAKRKLLPDLWSSLFLIVPVVSTTFASIWNMIGNLPDESIGWLLVDEAGQASPQSAVGAIRRARNVVVVGDPIQIQPVVTLPDQLVVQISDYFSVDANLWAAPHASVQTLADRVSPCQSEFRSESGLRKVGSPLLVHRRCESPMFDISNTVAYSGQMVSQVCPTDGGAIRQSLGPSRWINIEGDASSKWCQAEGSAVIDLFRKLKEEDVSAPDVFIVSPFRIVAEEMRRLCRTETNLFRALNIDVDEFCRTRIGTVHTVQGREADTVIFLLGAPMQHQAGARNWAGSPENLLNVAVSRSKRNLYVIGSRAAWMRAGCFAQLSSVLK